MKQKRKIPLVVLSDIHLGTYGCHAKELLHYLKSIQPQTLVLNGDMIDMWNFSKRYFPAAHMNVLRHIIKMSNQGTRVIYITGNHDEALRKYSDFILGNLELVDKLILDLQNKIDMLDSDYNQMIGITEEEYIEQKQALTYELEDLQNIVEDQYDIIDELTEE